VISVHSNGRLSDLSDLTDLSAHFLNVNRQDAKYAKGKNNRCARINTDGVETHFATLLFALVGEALALHWRVAPTFLAHVKATGGRIAFPTAIGGSSLDCRPVSRVRRFFLTYY
jgi:hypothetical protein